VNGGGTLSCGLDECGIVFELVPSGDGKWIEKVLHRFHGGDGGWPNRGLVLDASGNLYGTTSSGSKCGGQKPLCGTVFLLKHGVNGKWTEKVLHRFGEGTDGNMPLAGLISDAIGNLYGTTIEGGDHSCMVLGCGVVFKLSRGANGEWTEKVLHRFSGEDGLNPDAGLIVDARGNLYGTTYEGGSSRGEDCESESGGCGTVFQLVPNAGGTWTETVLYSFDGTHGDHPDSDLIFDTAGNLFGMTYVGGKISECYGKGCGVVFELTPNADGKWAQKVLYRFCSVSRCADGATPFAGLVLDKTGNLYGTTSGGGLSSGAGTVFKLALGANGEWTETVLYRFCSVSGCVDGAFPDSTLIVDAAGNLYGATEAGGPRRVGAVFEITP